MPDDLDTIVMKMLRRDRNERYATAKDLYADLRMFLNRYDPLFNEGELADYMQSMFKIEMVEARDLDGFAEKIAFAEQKSAEEPTVSLEAWDILPKEAPMGARPQKLHLVGADGGAAMSVVLETDDKEEAPRVDNSVGPRTMPRAPVSAPMPPFGSRPGEAAPPVAASQSRLAPEELRATMPEPDEDDEDSLSGDLVVPTQLSERSVEVELSEQTVRPPIAELVQAPTATIELDEAIRLGMVAEPPISTLPPISSPKVSVTVPVPLSTRSKVEIAPQLLSGSALLQQAQPKGPRGIVLFLGATAIVFVACLLLSLVFGTEPATQEAHAQPPAIEVTREAEPVAVGLSDPIAPPVELIAEEPAPSEAEPEVVRLKSYEEPAAEVVVAEDVEAPAILVEEVEPGDEEPDREREDRPRRARGGTMLVNSRPVSTIYVDGERIGRTPKVITLKPGKYEIELEGPNGQKKGFSKKIAAGKNPAITWRWR